MGPVKMAIPVDTEHARSVAVTTVKATGALLREGTTKDLDTRAKGANSDIMTDLDFAAERLIVRLIRNAFPSHRIIAEESGPRHRRQLLGLARGLAGWH
jgi:myo-inositol-1(or 4)-monophosphatase